MRMDDSGRLVDTDELASNALKGHRDRRNDEALR